MGGMWQRDGRGFARLALVASVVGLGTGTLFVSSSPAGASSPLSVGALSVTSWTVNQPGFAGTVAVSGGTGPYSVSASSGLPTGLTPSLSGGTVSFVGTPSVVGTFSSGSVTVKDSGGASDTTTFSITISSPDNDLVISRPANITNVNATSPSGAVVTYSLPAVSDPDDTTLPTPSCAPASGSTFAIGTTTVNCSVSDSDDTNSPVSTSFTVSVLGAPTQLANLHSAVTGVGPGKVLSTTVGAAATLLAHGHLRASCLALQIFVFEVKVGEATKWILATTGSQLIAAAERIEDVMGC